MTAHSEEGGNPARPTTPALPSKISPGPDSVGRRQLVSGAARLGLGTFLSRLLGLGRDIARAYLFGTGMAADAFTVAFRLPNLLRALFAEGALSASLVPVLSRYVEGNDPKETERFLRAVSGTLLLALTVTTLFGILLAPILVPFLVHGFERIPGKVELTVTLTQLLFPYLILIGMATLMMGVLNTHRHFTAPALAPALLNVVLIAAVLWLCPRLGPDPSRMIFGLAWAVLLGGCLQVLIQIVPLRKRGLRLWPSRDLRHPGVGKVLLLMIPGLVGISAQEINAFVDIFLASLLRPGSAAALEYGQRVMQVPLGIFGVALGTAVLPTLSRQVARGQTAEAEDTTAFSLRLAMLVLLPAGLWLILLADPILILLFRRGAFDQGDSLAMTNLALTFFAAGLPAYGSAKSLVPLFYAHGDTRTPVRASLISLGANVVLNLILMQFLELGGLALATALSSFLNVALLLRWSRSRLGLKPERGMARCLRVLAPATLFSGLVAWGTHRLLLGHLPPGFLGSLVLAIVPLLLAGVTYGLLLDRLHSEEWRFLRRILTRRLTGGSSSTTPSSGEDLPGS